MIVCDRPNPIGGVAVEGPMLVPGFESFVGLYPIPMRHGMTIGELARLFNEQFGIGADLEVVDDGGLDARDVPRRDGLPWVMPSPNMPTLDTAIVYPGTVLFEGTNVSEGRGTTRPFELLGAPWVVAERFADALNAPRLPGVFFRPAVFEPTFHKHAKTSVRRLPDPRHRSRARSGRSNRRRADRGVPRGRPERVRAGASRRTSTNTRSCRSTSSPGRPRACASRSKRGVAAPRTIARLVGQARARQIDAFCRRQGRTYLLHLTLRPQPGIRVT